MSFAQNKSKFLYFKQNDQETTQTPLSKKSSTDYFPITITNHTRYTLVQTVKETIEIVTNVLLKQEIISVDCEGERLSKDGRLTLIQIGLNDKRVFIFDILKGGSLMFTGLSETKPGLKKVLESKNILKLIHDCRNDFDSMLYQYNVKMFGFIDTQEVHFVYDLFFKKDVSLPISLLKFIKIYVGEDLSIKEKMKSTMHNDPMVWGQRPLKHEMLIYAAEDVKYLAESWNNLSQKLNKSLINSIKMLSIFKVIDKELHADFQIYLMNQFFINQNLVQQGQMRLDQLLYYDYVTGFLEVKKNEEYMEGFLVDNDEDIEDSAKKEEIKRKKQRMSFLGEMVYYFKNGKKNTSFYNNRNKNVSITNYIFNYYYNINDNSKQNEQEYEFKDFNTLEEDIGKAKKKAHEKFRARMEGKFL